MRINDHQVMRINDHQWMKTNDEEGRKKGRGLGFMNTTHLEFSRFTNTLIAMLV